MRKNGSDDSPVPPLPSLVTYSNLMVDPKTRKVIVLENPLLPTSVKDMIARVLFDNLQVRLLPFPSLCVQPNRLPLPRAGTVGQLRVSAAAELDGSRDGDRPGRRRWSPRNDCSSRSSPFLSPPLSPLLLALRG